MSRIDSLLERVAALEAQVENLERINIELRADLDQAEEEFRAQFWRGFGVGAGGATVVGIIIWLVSSLTN